jgi:hypothetical protein
MSEFITRFLNVRSVVKSVYVQIHELYLFNRERVISLGTNFDYEWEWYVAEQRGIDELNSEILRLLNHVKKIYVDLISILKCSDIRFVKDLRYPDDPRKDIMDELCPKVDLDSLDNAMAYDSRLCYIVERIYNTIYLNHTDYEGEFVPHSFFIRGKFEMWQLLRENRLSTAQQKLGSRNWSEVENVKCNWSAFTR